MQRTPASVRDSTERPLTNPARMVSPRGQASPPQPLSESCWSLLGRSLRAGRPGGSWDALLVPADLLLERGAVAEQRARRQRGVDQPDRAWGLEHAGAVDVAGPGIVA